MLQHVPRQWHLSLILSVVLLISTGCHQAEELHVTPPSPSTSVATTTTTGTASSTTSTSIVQTTTTSTIRRQQSVLLEAPILCQYPEYPTGCEAVTAVMALRYAGDYTNVASFIDQHMEMSMDFWWEGDTLHGPSPYEYYLGDPRSEQSYGCMAPVIEKALISFLQSDHRVQCTTGTPLQELCSQFLDQKIPVIIWASTGMSPILEGRQWMLRDGSLFTWPSGEHCLLLIGYDPSTYYFNDPTYGHVIRYDKQAVEARYADLGMQSLAVLPKQA